MFLYSLIVLILASYLYIKWKYTYWKRKGVLYAEPTFLLGFMDTLVKRHHMITPMAKLYDQAKAEKRKYCGHYEFLTPVFTPIDLELIKTIMQTGFGHFDRHWDPRADENADPLSRHLFNLGGEKWKMIRSKMAPTFTSGKIKMMFETMVSCTQVLEDILRQSPKTKPIEITDVLSRFTMDIIGSVGFGLDINSMKNPDTDFQKYGRKSFKFPVSKVFRLILINMLPLWLVHKLKIPSTEPDITSFFKNLVKTTVSYREKNNIFRKDFLHMLIQLKNFGRLLDEEKVVPDKTLEGVTPSLTLNEITAQVFVFFAAGFDTSAITMSFALFELAQHKDIQNKARNEVRRIFGKYNGKITYDGIIEMEYLDQIVMETLRKYPPVGVVPRECTKDFHVPDSDLVIYKGQRVQIPAYSIQRDSEYFPNPELFDPERFNNENKATIPPMAYIPFGEGPRICIGQRFGKLQVKVGLCCVLKDHEVSLNDKTKIPLQYESAFILSVAGGIWLNLKEV
nr:cytochrome P450 [Agasicles hygrophila]